MKEKDKDIFEQTTKFNTGIKLYMFQTGTIKTKLKFIKMNPGRGTLRNTCAMVFN